MSPKTASTPGADMHASEEASSEPTGLIVGRFAHVVIGTLLEEGIHRSGRARGAPLTELITRTVNALPLEQVKAVHPYAVGQQLVAAASIYFRLFLPGEEWTFQGREIAGSGCRFDLVFAGGDEGGRIFVDQIKTGRLEQSLERRNAEEQIAAEVKAGAKKWGERFDGVRLVLLGAPARSRFTAVDGTTTPIRWQGCDERAA